MKQKLFRFSCSAVILLLIYSCETHELSTPGNLVPLTVKEDSSLPSIEVNGTLLHSETFGNPNDPMVIAIHGGPGGDYRSLLNFQQLTAEGFYVVFYDQRGSGLSKRHDASTYNTQLFINDLDALINHYQSNDTQKVFLAGHSWGAMLATGYINQNPTKISGAILMEPGGFVWKDVEDYMGRVMKIEFLKEPSNDLVYLDQFVTGRDHNVLDYKYALSQTANTNIGDSEIEPFWRFGAVCNSSLLEFAMDNPIDFTTNLKSYPTKVLFCYSELNKSYGKKHAEKVSSAYPNAELFMVNNCGHGLHYFGWDYLYPKAIKYLKALKQNNS